MSKTKREDGSIKYQSQNYIAFHKRILEKSADFFNQKACMRKKVTAFWGQLLGPVCK
jgi:hypothetical protein